MASGTYILMLELAVQVLLAPVLVVDLGDELVVFDLVVFFLFFVLQNLHINYKKAGDI